jgi:hypothetical protein
LTCASLSNRCSLAFFAGFTFRLPSRPISVINGQTSRVGFAHANLPYPGKVETRDADVAQSGNEAGQPSAGRVSCFLASLAFHIHVFSVGSNQLTGWSPAMRKQTKGLCTSLRPDMKSNG